MRNWNNLFGGTVPRLEKLRAKAARHNAPTWRTVRYSGFNAPYPAACPGFNDNAPILSAFSADALPVRGITFADEVREAHIDHSGWYADGHGDQGTIRGIVASLPHGRFLPGYYWSDNGEYVLFTGQTFDSAEDAAREADHEAEKYAEICREDNARFNAMQDAEALVESKESDICEAWAEYRAAWCAYLNDPRHARTAVKARDWVRELITDLRAFRREYEDAKTAYERG